MKKRFLKSLSGLLAAGMLLSVAACSSAPAPSDAAPASGGNAASTVKIGVIDDATGNNAAYGTQKIAAYKLAADEINAAGGIDGKQIELIVTDSQSDNNKYQELARKLVLEDKVDVVMAGLTSASREAIRPIMEENKTLYFYNQQYEGGVASHYTFCTGAVPEHQIFPLMQPLIKQYGGDAYIIAADYNFGQITSSWMQKEVEKYGGKIVGKEFIPLEVSQFSSTISNIQAAKPNILITLLVGNNQTSFFEQWAKEGIPGLPLATTVTIVETGEHKLFAPPALTNTYVLAAFLEELNTPAAQDFVKKFRAVNPVDKIPYMGMETETVYSSMYLYKEAVEKAKTTETEAVITALESGISFDGPGGTVTIDGASHHTIRDMVLFKCDETHTMQILESFKAIKPTFLTEDMKIDLTKEAPNAQYEPK